MLIRSASGLRGIAEDHFTPELIDNYISAFISTQNIKSCVIGRDGRPSGKQISQWVIDSFHKIFNKINTFFTYFIWKYSFTQRTFDCINIHKII